MQSLKRVVICLMQIEGKNDMREIAKYMASGLIGFGWSYAFYLAFMR
jgi:hypothetical protein